jgi:hypothetical protein
LSPPPSSIVFVSLRIVLMESMLCCMVDGYCTFYVTIVFYFVISITLRW